MRTIKFRAWNEKKKKMEMVGAITFNANGEDGTVVDDCEWRCIGDIDEGFVLMQFTGLHDKNGKEIYEGDIVKHRNGIKEVTYVEDAYSFQMDLSDFVLDQELSISSEDIEVIGNIYENPELLEVR